MSNKGFELRVSAEFTEAMMSALSQLSPKSMKNITNRAVRRAGQTMRKEAVKGASHEYRVSGVAVRKTITFRNTDTGVMFISRGQRIGAEKFKYSPGRIGRRHTPLKLSVRRDTSPKAMPRAFVMKKNGAIFRRVDADRVPIKHIFGPSVPQMIGDNEAVTEAMKSGARETMNKVLSHEIKRVMMRK